MTEVSVVTLVSAVRPVQARKLRWRARVAVAVALAVTAGGCGWFDAEPVARVEPPGTTTTTLPPRPPGDPGEVGRRFLAAWAAGDHAGASQLTDSPDAAAKIMNDLRAQLPVAGIAADAPPAAGPPEVVRFTVNVTLQDIGTWAYASTLRVVDHQGEWRVAWAPSVLHPRLKPDATLKLTESPGRAGATVVHDRHGTPLEPAAHPSLAPTILPALLRAASTIPGPPAVTVQLVERSGGIGTLEQVRPAGGAGAAPSTLDAGIQTAAQQALATVGRQPAALVVLEAATGDILAIASNPPEGRLSTHARQPPGSAWKIVVASALLAAGASPDSPVPCTPDYQVPQGRLFRNEHGGDTNPGADLAYDFAVSCNTAFIAEGRRLLDPPRLFEHAGAVYGLTGAWDIGLGAPMAYWSLPDPGADRDLWSADLIGQGNLTVEPLAMASVVATAWTGHFRQPRIVPGFPQAPGRVGAPSAALQRMMRQAVTGGTARSLAGLGDVGAKTGTADVTGGNVAWMAAHRNGLAIACMVQAPDGTGGNDIAGPVVAELLRRV